MPTTNHSSLSQITVGSFDGLHAGHQTIIHHLVADAHAQGQKAVVVTFYPNPTVFFKKIRTPFYLTTNSEKTALLQKLGIDETIILPFNQELAQSSAEDFIRYLLQRVPFDTIYIGYDFHFGADRTGDREKLFELGKKYGFTVRVQQPVDLNATPISSSMIRTILSKGRVEDLSALLKRWYSMEGEVIHGDGRGKKMGVPTANIAYEPQKLLPPNGIYAARIQIGAETRPAATNVGFRPTFYETPSIKTVEAFILDWERDIYGKTVTLKFVRRLRDEIQYHNTQALTAQIQKDIESTRKIVNHE